MKLMNVPSMKPKLKYSPKTSAAADYAATLSWAAKYPAVSWLVESG